jgi:ATP-dependent DNA helicase DinG
MARLVARALRLQRSALIQTGFPPVASPYAVSYLAPALLWPGTVAIVAEVAVQQRLVASDLPQLQAQLGTSKAICSQSTGDGLLLLAPEQWLAQAPASSVPVIIDGADRLEQWVSDWLQVKITPSTWAELLVAMPDRAEEIRDRRVQLTKSIFQRPVNPYNCYLLSPAEQQMLPAAVTQLMNLDRLDRCHPDQLLWAKVDRQQGTFTLFAGQVDMSATLAAMWARQTHILVGNVLDVERAATSYRQELGLGEMTCVKFAASRPLLPQLYVPNWMPMPNTRKFQEMLWVAMRQLLAQRVGQSGLIAIVIGDTPLKAQIAAQVAAEYGSRVQVEKLNLGTHSILITGWEFWNDYQQQLPRPQLLLIATLPIPSLEDPLVAAKVSYYKRQRQDWFRSYLLPTGLRVLQRSLFAIRHSAGLVAIFDNRINHRSYGKQVLAALSPMTRVDTPLERAAPTT